MRDTGARQVGPLAAAVDTARGVCGSRVANANIPVFLCLHTRESDIALALRNVCRTVKPSVIRAGRMLARWNFSLQGWPVVPVVAK